ncbi:MAG: hypothetical protein SFX74_01000 [Fimbriimonadaceae bacterium]|nr:hypothetical protein [Fimbriimonadaceae bacterium]
MRAWRFSKPKGPGFGISQTFYLSVLSSRPVLPSPHMVANPKGVDGAVTGFAVPLGSAKGKDALQLPMEFGGYAIASTDRKTVLAMQVMSRDTAGFDPEPFARSLLALNFSPEVVSRVRGTWQLMQMKFESHAPEVYPSLDFLQDVCIRLAMLTEGVVADSISARYQLPQQVRMPVRADARVDAREHIAVAFRDAPTGIHAYTLGLQKFALPEFEITGLRETDQTKATTYLHALSQTVLVTGPVKLGLAYGPFQVSEGGFDKAHWRGLPVYELLPDRKQFAGEALESWRP